MANWLERARKKVLIADGYPFKSGMVEPLDQNRCSCQDYFNRHNFLVKMVPLLARNHKNKFKPPSILEF